MRNFLFTLVFFALIASCKQQDSPQAEQSTADRISLLEARMGAQPTPEVHEELLSLYEQQRADTTLSQDLRMMRARYLAEAEYAKSHHQAAFDMLRSAIKDFPTAQGRPEAGLLMAEIAIQRLNEPSTAEIIFAMIRDRYPNSNATNLIPVEYEVKSVPDVIQGLQKAVFPSTGFNKPAAIAYGKASWVYTALETDENAIVKDHIASGRILEEAGQFQMALAHYKEVTSRFPHHERAGDAAFLEAFIVFDHQQKEAEGRALLENYLKHYPGHKLNGDATALLQKAG